MKRFPAVTFFLVLLLSQCKTVYLDQSVLFYPDLLAQYDSIPFLKEINLIDSANQRITGLELKKPGRQKVLLFFHGNSGSVWDRDFPENIKIADTLGYNLVAIDYTGYGKSPGQPSLHSLYLNASAVYEYAAKSYSSDSIFLWCESLGTIPTCRLAAEKKGRKVIIESGLTTSEEIIPNVVRNNVTPLKYIFVRIKTSSDLVFSPQEDIRRSKQPFLFIYGDQDKTIHPDQARRNYEAATNPGKVLYMVNGAGHNDTRKDFATYLQTMRTFLSK